MLSLALRIVRIAKSKKAKKLIVLDMRGVSSFCDYFVILSGTSLRHVNALGKAIQEDLGKDGILTLSRVLTDDESGWIVLDFMSVVVHIFHKPMREFYSLERLWSDAKRVRIPPSPPMTNDIQQTLISVIKTSLKQLSLESALKEDLYLNIPAEARLGDLSSNIALRLGRLTGHRPPEIAAKISAAIKECLTTSPVKDYIREVKAEGAGFINFYFSDKYFYEQLNNLMRRGRAYLKMNSNIGKNRRVLIEFVSANPTGPLSVAHARQAAVGDSLANILTFLGFKVKREYYLNDEGNQINILGESVALRLKRLNGKNNIDFPENYYQGEYIYDIAKEIKNQKSKIKNLGDFAAEYILNIIKKELDDFGVKFDYWRSQKKLRKSGKITKALGLLKAKGYLYEQDSAVWFKSTQFKDDKDRVIIKSDGAYTYLAPDIAYHWEKYRRGFDGLINLWGPDHHGYINRLRAAVQALGYDQDSLSIIIVQLASICREGKSIEMSTRKGQYITLREVLDEVGLDASRFFFLMRRTSSHLDFDLETAKKHTPENPVYYVQYAYARICSILRSRPVRLKRGADLCVLKEKEELGLIKKLVQFTYILNICYLNQDPYMLTVYLQDTASLFHKFYDQYRVLGQVDNLTQARLSLIKATRVIIGSGLELLGVSHPENM